MDCHTIRGLKQQSNGHAPSDPLVYVEPEASLENVVHTLIEKGCSMAPIVAIEEDRKVKHTGTIDKEEDAEVAAFSDSLCSAHGDVGRRGFLSHTSFSSLHFVTALSFTSPECFARRNLVTLCSLPKRNA